MKLIERYNLIVKIIASITLVLDGWYYSATQPGIMDAINGSIAGLVLYVFWMSSERQPKREN